VLVGAAATLLVAAAVAVAALHDHSARRATSGRTRRVEVAARVWKRHPVLGAGIGAQPRASQQLSHRYAQPAHFVSHTTPLTIAAELGIVGLALYVALLAAAFREIDRVRRSERALGLTLALALLALVVHSLFYSGFFEDPLTWFVLGVTAAALVAPRPQPQRPEVRPAPEPVLAG
jgi:O-antigen ligase